MYSYYCIVNLPDAPAREIAVVSAADDLGAQASVQRIADQWPGFETVELYDGERLVSRVVSARTDLGAFSPDGLGLAA